MKIKSLIFPFVAFLGLFFFISSQDVSAASGDSESSASQIKFYDENNNQIYPYSLEELNHMVEDSSKVSSTVSEVSILTNYRTYSSPAFNFKYNYWIGTGGTYGTAFLNLVDTQVTPQGTAKPFDIVVYYSAGTGYGNQAGRVSLPGGWVGGVHMSWSHLPRNNSYRINFVNQAGSSVTNYIENVTVLYDPLEEI